MLSGAHLVYSILKLCLILYGRVKATSKEYDSKKYLV